MNIKKRNGGLETYDRSKICNAVKLAFQSVKHSITQEELDAIASRVEEQLGLKHIPDGMLQVEQIQDMVEVVLTQLNYYEVLKSFILYRNERTQRRNARQYLMAMFGEFAALESILKSIQKEYNPELYNLYMLAAKFTAFNKDGLSLEDKLSMLIKAASELTTREAPKWEFIAGRFLMLKFSLELAESEKRNGIQGLYSKIKWLTDEGLYGNYILKAYHKEDIDLAESYIDNSRNNLLNYSGLDLLLNRYVIRSFALQPLESPQEMFIGIALHLAMKETENRMEWVKRFLNRPVAANGKWLRKWRVGSLGLAEANYYIPDRQTRS